MIPPNKISPTILYLPILDRIKVYVLNILSKCFSDPPIKVRAWNVLKLYLISAKINVSKERPRLTAENNQILGGKFKKNFL